jgi:rhodanese-related sulfurtransferase
MNVAPRITPQTLKTWLRDGAELALIDVREQGVYYHGHLLFATCIPVSKLEMMVADLIPRRATRVVLCDGGEGDLVDIAAAKLTFLGYENLSVLDGGTQGWREAGYELFSGINVPSKAFGEYVEQRYDTPRISARELAEKQAAKENLVILDSRPMPEFHNMSIPAGIDCPGAELVYRVFDAAPDPETLVVVNCAGRTRSIIGAQSLINARIANPVVALKDGTMGWQLAGLALASGRTEHAPAPTAAGLRQAQAAAARVAQAHGVRTVDPAQLRRWEKERDARTLYLFDVRTSEEYAAGHLPGSRSAPGGQLVQATDEYIATRHARIVLVDDERVRANMSASWLRQMGWEEVYVLQGPWPASLERGPFQPALLDFAAAPEVSASALKAELDAGADIRVLDLATSLQYRKQHIPSAYWGVRSRLDQALATIGDHAALVLTSPDGVLAHYAARDLQRANPSLPVRVLLGGSEAWFATGFPQESGAQRLTSEPNDVWYKPYEQRESRQAMQDYLTWEVNLVEQIERDGDTRFR